MAWWWYMRKRINNIVIKLNCLIKFSEVYVKNIINQMNFDKFSWLKIRIEMNLINCMKNIVIDWMILMNFYEENLYI